MTVKLTSPGYQRLYDLTCAYPRGSRVRRKADVGNVSGAFLEAASVDCVCMLARSVQVYLVTGGMSPIYLKAEYYELDTEVQAMVLCEGS